MPVETALAKHTFSQMELIKTRLRNYLSDGDCACQLKIAVEGPELNSVPIQEIWDVF